MHNKTNGGGAQVAPRGVKVGQAMIKAAFFDIDGTLQSFRTHEVPASAEEALACMHDRGIKLFIATGRSSAGIPPATRALLERVPFEGLLTFNGQYCYDDAGVYRDRHIDEADVRVMVEQAREGRYALQVMQLSGSFVSARPQRVLETERHVGGTFHTGELERAFAEPVYQTCVFVDPGEEHVFMDACENVEHTRWCDWFCDVIPRGGGKPAGIAATLARHGIAPDEAVAFGDGGNDVAMFGCVGASVAMGNASDAVKAAATHVTDDIDEDGLLHACQALGLV